MMTEIFLKTSSIYFIYLRQFVVLFSIGTIVCFALKWIFKKYSINTIKKKTLVFVSAFILSYAIWCVANIMLFISDITEAKLDFDKAKWMANMSSRYEMADMLIENNTLIGMDTSRVRRFLGAPNPYASGKDSLNIYWTYNMGFGGGFAFVQHTLMIDFENGKAVCVKHIRVED
jgi:hypothetical protein